MDLSELKAAGNKAFSLGRFNAAINSYTEAIVRGPAICCDRNTSVVT
jgi:hypothetical protein